MKKFLEIIKRVKSIDRFLLILGIICITVSAILTFYFGDNLNLDNEIISIFIWFSIIGCIWICILSFLFLLISIPIYRIHKIEIWTSLKWEILLTIGLIASLTIFHLCTLIVY